MLSTFLVGTAMFYILGFFGSGMPYIYCLLFGAIISPTDPIAVLGILRDAGAPKTLEVKITGESLFNDGVGVVVFLSLLAVATGGGAEGHGGASVKDIAVLFLEEALGGVVFGLVLGLAAYWLLKSVDNYQVEVLVTLAVVAGGYALAWSVHTSGPLAMVVAGLLVGNHGRQFAMSDRTREHLDMFWELVDEILNAVLFVLIGLELVAVSLNGTALLLGLVAIPVVLLARFLALGVPVSILKIFRPFTPGALRIMTWGGLRGGISVALALALPRGPEREIILTMTYTVVVFSILVQGLTLKGLVARTLSRYGLNEDSGTTAHS
jgi:CPA1 family monovalent cation:H+ antiporter